MPAMEQLLSLAEVGSRAKSIYANELKAQVENEGNIGKFITIDVLSGDYEVGTNHIATVEAVRARHKNVHALRFFEACATIPSSLDQDDKTLSKLEEVMAANKNALAMTRAKNLPTKREAADRAAVGQNRALHALDQLCTSLAPGDRIPTHTELMRRFDASERAVRDALDEMRRRGRIVRRNGVGTFVAPPTNAQNLPPVSATQSRTIVVLTQPDQGFFDRCMNLLFRQAESANLTILCQPVSVVKDSLETVDVLTALQPIGFIVFSYRLADIALRLQNDGYRVVIVGAPPTNILPEVPCIYNDHEYGGYVATRHLIELGHRRIAYIQAGAGDLSRERRWQGHLRALREARELNHLSLVDTFLPEKETETWDGAPDRVRAFFADPDSPTGLVAWNDHEAVRVLTLLTRAGVRVPHEVSLVGYDALPEGSFSSPRLTTIEHSINQQIHMAVNLLTQPEPAASSHTVIVTPTLVPRDSTGRVPVQSIN